VRPISNIYSIPIEVCNGINITMYTTLNLIKPMGEVITITGDPVRAAGWYGPNNGLHSITINVQNFTGRVSIQAALTPAPQDSDWFSILPNAAPYIQYPQRTYVVTSPSTGETSNYQFTFAANVMFVRAIIDRSYFIPAQSMPPYIGSFGLVDSIVMKYGDNLGEFQYKRDWDIEPQSQPLPPFITPLT
jgi:hypothetical protein